MIWDAQPHMVLLFVPPMFGVCVCLCVCACACVSVCVSVTAHSLTFHVILVSFLCVSSYEYAL